MTTELCEFEAMLALATRTGSWSEELRQHMKSCAACKEAHRAAAFFSQVATEVAGKDPLPDPIRIWLRARLEREIEAEIRASRSRLWSLGLAGITAALGGWLAWRTSAVALSAVATELSGSTDAWLLTAAGIALVGATTGFASWQTRRRSRFWIA